MRLKPTTLPPTIFETFPRIIRNASKTSTTVANGSQQSPFTPARTIQQSRPMASASGSGFAEYGIENSVINSGAGVQLSDSQKLLVGSVLDLFAGRPSKRKLTLWTDNGVFADPLTIAEGRKQYEAQWYGLKAVFSNIERISSEVKSASNPIELSLKTKYTVKGLGSEQTINSQVLIHTTSDEKQITKVEDRWDGNIPEGVFAKAMRNLNSVVVPALVSVPNSVEEEESKSN